MRRQRPGCAKTFGRALALDNTKTFWNHIRTMDDHSTKSVCGVKKIEALGALKLLSGGSGSLAPLDDMHYATGRDLNLVVGQKHNTTAGGDMQEKIEGLRKSIAGASQRLQAPRTWVGSANVNVLRVLGDLIDLVEEMRSSPCLRIVPAHLLRTRRCSLMMRRKRYCYQLSLCQ